MSSALHRLKNPRTALVLLVLLALVLRLPNLGQSVWFDEACMARQRLGTFGQMITTLYVDNHPPLYVLFMYGWVALFGDGEVVMRLPSLVAGLLSIPLTYAIGARLIGRRAGLAAALLMCLSPVMIWYSIEARLYAHILLLALLAVWLFHRLLDGGRRRDWIVFVLLVAVMPLVHYYLTVFLGVFVLLGLLAKRIGGSPRAGRWVAVWSALAIVGILAFVALKLSMAEFNTSLGYMGDLTWPESYRLLFQWAWTGDASAGGPLPSGAPSVSAESPGWLFWVVLQVVGVALFLRGLVAIRRLAVERPEAWCVLVYLACMPLFLLVLPWVGLHGTYISRSILPFVPFLFLVISVGWSSLSTPRARAVIGGSVLALLLVNLAVFYAREDEWTVYKPHQDWRAAAVYLTSELEAGASGRPVFTTMPNQRSLSYYDARIQTRTNLQPTMGKLESARRIFEERLGAEFGGWLADQATRIAEEVEATRLGLLEGTELLVFPLTGDTVEALDGGLPGKDDVLYVLHNLWNPPGDALTPVLVTRPGLELIERRDFRGLSLFKLRRVR